jgi:hypothetical protein
MVVVPNAVVISTGNAGASASDEPLAAEPLAGAAAEVLEAAEELDEPVVLDEPHALTSSATTAAPAAIINPDLRRRGFGPMDMGSP